MDNKLTDKELKFIKHYHKQRWTLYFLLIFVLIMTGASYYLIFNYYEPKVAHIYEDKPVLKEFIEKNNAVYLKPTPFFVSLLIGIIIGNIYSHRKLSQILNKLLSKNQLNE